MKTKKTHLGMLGIVMVALAALPAATAVAGDRDDHRDRDRGSSWRHGGREGHGGVSVQFDLGRPALVQRWIPGHFETRIERALVEEGHFMAQTEQVLVEAAHWQDRYVPAVTETRRDYQGRLYTVILVPARTERVWVPAVYETRFTRVWCPPRYEDRGVRFWVEGCYVTEQAPSRPLINFQGAFGW